MQKKKYKYYTRKGIQYKKIDTVLSFMRSTLYIINNILVWYLSLTIYTYVCVHMLKIYTFLLFFRNIEYDYNNYYIRYIYK